MMYAFNVAGLRGSESITLEVECTEQILIQFYKKLGFEIESNLANYYGSGRHAYGMRLKLATQNGGIKPTNQVIVTDIEIPWLSTVTTFPVVAAETYLTDRQYVKKSNLKVFNLCRSYAYQSLGYYVSLMATARNHRVVPNVATVNDFSDPLIITSFGEEVDEKIQNTLSKETASTVQVMSCFGYSPNPRYEKLVRSLFTVFEAPVVEFTLEKGKRWKIVQARIVSIGEMLNDPFMPTAAGLYFQQKRMSQFRLKDYAYDLAILHDPDEREPPSNRGALVKFKSVAQKYGFFVEFITSEDYARLTEFDALFIRTTTHVNDISYQFSRYAYAEGLVVIDDPWSILKCSNKLFFTESMKKIGVATPKTMFVSERTQVSDITSHLQYPVVLKQPDSAFSLGVFKVTDEAELAEKLPSLLQASALVIAQNFIPSAFDWRIGVIAGIPFYACQYFMAHNHWQILNWQSKRRKDREGSVTAVPLEEVPSHIITAAVKAAQAMGDGLYGVDVKDHLDTAYVIEVNDNPNIDHGYEDGYYKDVVYHTIIKTFVERIETARGLVKVRK
jgi:glutathione synthase/RimK-type ligase-like ATP-grasp enzyme